MEKLKVLDLFSGIGGFSLGLERTGGFETVAFCEIDPFCQKVLKKHWPEVRQYNDVTTAEFEGTVDLVTAGFPCQDISFAGQGAGLSGERSGLFWHVLRTAGLVGFPKLLLENVAALLDRGLGAVLGSMAEIGYDAEWHCIPASHAGADHERDRIWIVADSSGERQLGGSDNRKKRQILRDKIRTSPKSQSERQRWIGRFGEAGSDEQGSLVQRWEAKSGILGVCDEVPNRVDRISGCGNSVIPDIPEIIGRAILESM